MVQPKEYYAFISYKREDKKEAKRLQHALEYYRLPNHLRQENPELPEYVRPVFRDMTDLEVGELSAQIHSALEQSHFLIVVCSPRAAASKWVNDEVECFISLGKQDKIIPYIIEGVPHASNPDEECYPPALLRLSKEKELLGANINEVGKYSATIRVVSRMFNIRFDTLFQRYQREQKKRRRQLIVAIVMAFLFLSGIVGWIWHQNNLLKEREYKMRLNQARAVAEKASAIVDDGDSYLARLLLLDIKDDYRTTEWESAFRKACDKNNCIFRGHTGDVNTAIFSYDGKYVVSTSGDKTIRIWNVMDGTCRDTLIGHTDVVNSAVFSLDGQYVASASSDSTIRIWNTTTSECIKVLKDHSGSVESVSFSADGKKIASISSDNSVRIWDIRYETDSLLFNDDVNGTLQNVTYSNDGNWLIVCARKGIYIWNLERRNYYVIKGLKEEYNDIAISPDSKYLAFATFNTIKIWDIEKSSCIDSWDISVGGVIYSLSYSHDGKYLVITSMEGIDHSRNDNEQVVKILEINSKYYWKTVYKKGIGFCFDVDWSPCSNQIVYLPSEKSKEIRMIDASKYIDERNEVISNGARGLHSSSFDENYHYLGGKYLDYRVVNTVSRSKDGKYQLVVYACNESVIYLYDILQKELDCDSIPTGNGVRFASISPDNNYVVSANDREEIMLWEIKTKKCIHKNIHAHNALINTVMFNPEGDKIISASLDGTVKIWDLQLKQIDELYIEENSVNCSASYSPDEKYIITNSNNGIRVWDSNNLKLVYDIPSYDVIGFEDAFFSMKNDAIWISRDDCLLSVPWFSMEQLVDYTHNQFKNRQLTPEERRRYYLE